MVMDSPVHGRGLFAARDYAAGETVLVEAPLVKMQDVGNRQDVLVCSECLCFLDVSRTLLAKVATGATTRQAAEATVVACGGCQGRERVIQRRFNVGVLEASPERNASTRRVRPER